MVHVHSADSSRLFGMGWKAQSPTQVLLLCPPQLSVWVSLLSPTSPIYQTPFSLIQFLQGTSHHSKGKAFLLRLKVQVWITNLLNPAQNSTASAAFCGPDHKRPTHPPPLNLKYITSWPDKLHIRLRSCDYQRSLHSNSNYPWLKVNCVCPNLPTEENVYL